jgi:hypothetical protein
MTLYEIFTTYYPALCVLYLNAAILAVLLPNRIIDTDSDNKHLIMVFLVIAGMAGLHPAFLTYSLVILGFLLSGITVHYVREWQRKKIKSFQSIQVHNTTDHLYKRVK